MSNFKLPSARVRLLVIAGAIALLFIVAALKAAMLQLGKGEALLSLSRQQTSRPVQYSGTRGDILDRNGHILSTSVVMSSIYAEPRTISDPAKVSAQLARLLPGPNDDLAERLNSNKSFVWVLRRADPNIVNRILGSKIDGLKVMKETRRFYPNHALLGQVLGLVTIDGEPIGGVEKALNNDLEPKSWRTLALADAKGDSLRQYLAPDPRDLSGSDIMLTIDRDIQYIAEETLLKTVKEHRAKGGWAIVIKPKTGEILALANVPLFNPNLPSSSSQEGLRNQAISRTGEPGSTFKMVTFASAFENGLITPDDMINCENGTYNLGFMTIKDIVKKGSISVTDVFKYSSNIGTYKIAEKVGPERLYQTIKKLGFGEVPGLGLIEEARGFVSKPSSWGKSRFANVSFGYGLMATSLQMLQVAAAVANDGILVPPKIVVGLESDAAPRRVLSEKAAAFIKALMWADTKSGGTGKRADIQGIDVAGKTGTAEKVDPETGKYSKTHNLSSFVGFAPVNSPEIAAIVVIDEPGGIAYGGFVAAPAWQGIVSAALNRQGI
jgi:cell division protein FtsI (penicillin-binding protein 3)